MDGVDARLETKTGRLVNARPHLGESTNPVVVETARSSTTKLMRTLADRLNEL